MSSSTSASAMTKEIEDVDFHNVVQGIGHVAHFAAATPTRARRGVRSSNVSELDIARGNLREDMHRLITSPHTQPRAQPALELGGDAITAIRSLWTVLQKMKSAVPGEAVSREAELKAAVRRAVTSLNPAHTFTDEEMEEGTEDDRGRPDVPRVK
jgi:hypothetical protein